MEIYSKIPKIDGLYSYVVTGKLPEPVLIDVKKYGEGKFKAFNGRTQSWIRENEWLIGPIELPNSI